MPEKETLERARRDRAQGKAPSTQAGEFVREEMEHVREGKHGARSTKQAIAIGLSKARRSGVKLGAPRGRGRVTQQAKRDLAKGRSRRSLSRQAKGAARRRSASSRSAAARKAARRRKAHGR
ncbi:MAG TPA: DUF6496 domain-containing protein [Myxococcales bacterium]|nr:DUF6496 domain-containing protein [Myxococcales bacterium]